MPSASDKRAKQEWRRLAPILQGMRVLTEADYMALANLCQTYLTLVKAQEKLNEVGILARTLLGPVDRSGRRLAPNCEHLYISCCAASRISSAFSAA
jgi:P27 family predicted phage terminase small subunit